MKRIFAILTLIALAGLARADVLSPNDSISVPLTLDSLGSRTEFDTSTTGNVADWGYIIVYAGKSGAAVSVFSDTFAIKKASADISVEAKPVTLSFQKVCYHQRATVLTGSPTASGWYSYEIQLRDSSAQKWAKPIWGNFYYLYTGGSFNYANAVLNQVWDAADVPTPNQAGYPRVEVNYWRGGVVVPYFSGAAGDTVLPVKVVTIAPIQRDSLRNAFVLGTVATVNTSTGTDSSFLATGLTQASGYWNNYVILFVSGSHAKKASIVKRSTLQGGLDTVTFTPKLSSALGNGDTILIVPQPIYSAVGKGITDSTMSGLALADSVWTRDTSNIAGHAASNYGKVVNKAATSATATLGNAAMGAIADSVENRHIIDVLLKAIVVKEGVTSGTPTTTKAASAALTEADDYWTDNMVVFINGSAKGQSARITDMFTSGDSITYTPALSAAPAAGDSFVVLGMITESGSSTGVDSLKAYGAATQAILNNTVSVSNLVDTMIRYTGATRAVVGAGSSSTSIVTTRSEATTDYWKDALAVFYTGSLAGQNRRVTAYNGTTKALTVDALTGTPAQNDSLLLIPAGSGGNVALTDANMGAIADSVTKKNVSGYTDFNLFGTRGRIAGDSTKFATPGDVWKQKADSAWPSGSFGESGRLRYVAGFAMSLKPAGVFGNYIHDPLFLTYDTATTFSAGAGPYTINSHGTTTKSLLYDLPEAYKSLKLACTGSSGKDSLKVASRRAIQLTPGVYQYGVCMKKGGPTAIDSVWVTITDSTAGAASLVDTFLVEDASMGGGVYREFSEKFTLSTSKRINVQVKFVGTGGASIQIAYIFLRGGGGADPAAIATAVWNADTATYNNVAASYGLVLANPTYVQGSAASVTLATIVDTLRAQMNPATAGATTLGHYTAQRSDSGASTASIAAGVWAYATRSLTDKDNFTLSAAGNTAAGLAGWNIPFSTSFTAGSMGDSSNNPTWIGNLYSIGGGTYVASAAGLRDMFISGNRAYVYLKKLDIDGDNGSDGSLKINNSGGPGVQIAAASNSAGVSISAPGTFGIGVVSSGGRYGIWADGAEAGWYGSSTSGSAWMGTSSGSNPTFDMHNTGAGLGGWAGTFRSDNGGGLYTYGLTTGWLSQGVGTAGFEALGNKGIYAVSTAGSTGIHGTLDSCANCPAGSGSGSDTTSIKQLAANNPTLFYGPTSAGTGLNSVTIYTIDTSNSPDQTLQATKIAVQTSSGVNAAVAYTSTAGSATFALDPGTYNILGFRPPYTFPIKSVTVVGNTDSVGLPGYLSTAIRAGNVTAYVDGGIEIIDSLTGLQFARTNISYTLNLISPGGVLKNGTSPVFNVPYTKSPDNNGRVNFYVPANSALTPAGSYYVLTYRAVDQYQIKTGDVRRFWLDTASAPINIMTAKEIR